MWNNSYRTPTEYRQKTSDFPKGKKIPTYLGRAKEKRKIKRQRDRDGSWVSGGSCEGGSFYTLGSLFTGVMGVGSFRATEDRESTGVQKAKQRDSCTEDWCQPALTSLRRLSAHLLRWVGARS